LRENFVRGQVPVFLMGILIGGKKYDWTMYFQVAVVTAGVLVFNFGVSPPPFLEVNNKNRDIHIDIGCRCAAYLTSSDIFQFPRPPFLGMNHTYT